MADPTALAAAFWARFRADGGVDRAAVRALAGLAIGDGEQTARAVAVLFGEVVEPLGDAFGVAEAHAYVDVFAEVIDVARRHPRAAAIDRGLADLGLTNGQIAARGHRWLDADPAPVEGELRLAVVLSKVTLGAEIFQAATIVDALLARYPGCRVLFVGPEGSRGVFLGNDRVDFRAVDYPRRGDLLTRLAAWPAARAIVREATAGLPEASWLVVDPDSRITQLNLLPVAPDARTRFFPSRTIQRPGIERLGELAADWAHGLFGTRGTPTVWLTADARAWADRLLAQLRPHARLWAAVNFGVGANERKRVGPDFERAVLRGLIADRLGVLLSRGVTDGEVAATNALCEGLAAEGVDVVHLPPDGDPVALAAPGQRQLVTWQAPTERMAALVAAADLHVGYDSAGQHVASAVGTPGVTAFVPSAGPRFVRRWSTWGRGPARVVVVEPGGTDTATAVRQTLAAAADLLAAAATRRR
ncbi:MAG TPA: glycosyltransferase family 9 protein [Chloroflexota bacterium]|nr:glycosyltransferase family 9 protein [Chloroflexota bacterium]